MGESTTNNSIPSNVRLQSRYKKINVKNSNIIQCDVILNSYYAFSKEVHYQLSSLDPAKQLQGRKLLTTHNQILHQVVYEVLMI